MNYFVNVEKSLIFQYNPPHNLTGTPASKSTELHLTTLRITRNSSAYLLRRPFSLLQPFSRLPACLVQYKLQGTGISILILLITAQIISIRCTGYVSFCHWCKKNYPPVAEKMFWVTRLITIVHQKTGTSTRVLESSLSLYLNKKMYYLNTQPVRCQELYKRYMEYMINTILIMARTTPEREHIRFERVFVKMIIQNPKHHTPF